MTIFRAPEARDAAALVGMADALCLHQGDPTGNFTIEKALRDVIAPDAPLSCLVAEKAGALEGFVFWHFAYETCYAARGGHVTDLYVSENQRGSGIAEGLLRAAARSVKAAGRVSLAHQPQDKHPRPRLLRQTYGGDGPCNCSVRRMGAFRGAGALRLTYSDNSARRRPAACAIRCSDSGP